MMERLSEMWKRDERDLSILIITRLIRAKGNVAEDLFVFFGMQYHSMVMREEDVRDLVRIVYSRGVKAGLERASKISYKELLRELGVAPEGKRRKQ